jgi:ABC-type bacteriocin/lantibiotic exporter with double-glycine peptidase domain
MRKKAKGEGYFFAKETLPYIAKGVVIAQIQPNACLAATARMILKDLGISKSEAELRILFEIDDDGASPSKIPGVFAQFGLEYIY